MVRTVAFSRLAKRDPCRYFRTRIWEFSTFSATWVCLITTRCRLSCAAGSRRGCCCRPTILSKKTLDNISPGNPGLNSEDQSRVAAFLDNQNQHLDYGRADFDQTHVFNLNAVYDLPFGKGKYFLNGSGGAVDRLVGGWQLGGILRINTGTPLTIVDPRGTLNRVGRSANQTAVTNLTNAQISDLIGISGRTALSTTSILR
jgi:hypothetical protein